MALWRICKQNTEYTTLANWLSLLWPDYAVFVLSLLPTYIATQRIAGQPDSIQPAELLRMPLTLTHETTKQLLTS